MATPKQLNEAAIEYAKKVQAELQQQYTSLTFTVVPPNVSQQQWMKHTSQLQYDNTASPLVAPENSPTYKYTKQLTHEEVNVLYNPKEQAFSANPDNEESVRALFELVKVLKLTGPLRITGDLTNEQVDRMARHCPKDIALIHKNQQINAPVVRVEEKPSVIPVPKPMPGQKRKRQDEEEEERAQNMSPRR